MYIDSIYIDDILYYVITINITFYIHIRILHRSKITYGYVSRKQART